MKSNISRMRKETLQIAVVACASHVLTPEIRKCIRSNSHAASKKFERKIGDEEMSSSSLRRTFRVLMDEKWVSGGTNFHAPPRPFAGSFSFCRGVHGLCQFLFLPAVVYVIRCPHCLWSAGGASHRRFAFFSKWKGFEKGPEGETDDTANNYRFALGLRWVNECTLVFYAAGSFFESSWRSNCGASLLSSIVFPWTAECHRNPLAFS